MLFLEPNTNKELEEKETIEFKPNSEIITKPFDYKSSYVVVEGFRGAVQITTYKKKRIKEIKKAIDWKSIWGKMAKRFYKHFFAAYSLKKTR